MTQKQSCILPKGSLLKALPLAKCLIYLTYSSKNPRKITVAVGGGIKD